MTTAAILLQLSEWLGVGSVTWIAGVSKRFQRRPINFIYQRREYIVTFSMFVLALIIAWVVKTQFNLTATLGSGGLPEGLLFRLVISVILLAPFLAALLYRRQPARTMGWSSTLRPALQLGLGLLALVIFLHGKIFYLLNNFNSSTGLMILTLLAIAVMEESVFRGYIFIRLTAGLGAIPGLVATALLSTLWQIILFTNFAAAPLTIVYGIVVILGRNLLLGWIMQKSGHAAAPALYAAASNLMVLLP